MAASNSNQGGCSGRGHGDGHGNAGNGRGYNANKSKTTKVRLCKELEGNILDYGSKFSTDQMRTIKE